MLEIASWKFQAGNRKLEAYATSHWLKAKNGLEFIMAFRGNSRLGRLSFEPSTTIEAYENTFQRSDSHGPTGALGPSIGSRNADARRWLDIGPAAVFRNELGRLSIP